MTIDVNVRLKGKHLDVIDGEDGIEIPCGQGHRVVAWELDGAALDGAHFLPVDDTDLPGFSWVSTIPKNVFTRATLSGDKRRLIVDVDHVSTATGGHFIYMLRAWIGPGPDDIATTLKFLDRGKGCRTVTNPVIINK
jgi:hypothetical protein